MRCAHGECLVDWMFLCARRTLRPKTGSWQPLRLREAAHYASYTQQSLRAQRSNLFVRASVVEIATSLPLLAMTIISMSQFVTEIQIQHAQSGLSKNPPTGVQLILTARELRVIGFR